MYSISPTKSRYLGQKRSVDAFPTASIQAATISGTAMGLGLIFLTFFLQHFNIQADLVELVRTYLIIVAFSLIPNSIYTALKENLLAYGKTVFPNVMIWVFNLVNILINILFMIVFDWGIAGAGVATLLCRSLMAATLFIYSRHHLQFDKVWHGKLTWQIIKSGTPIALSNLVSGLIFCVVAILVAQMSVLDSAANNIMLNMTSLTYMFPLALSSAVAVKVGRHYGAKDFDKVRDYTWASMILGFGFSTIFTLIFHFFPTELTRLATPDIAVADCVLKLIFFVVLYQIPDAMQVIVLGCLRGLGITKGPLVLGIISIWLIGLPMGCYLAYQRDMGAAGLWAGMTIGLTLMGLALGAYLVYHLRAIRRESLNISKAA